MENFEKNLRGTDLLSVMNAASQKRIANALNALKAEGLIFYAVAVMIVVFLCLWPCEFKYMIRLTCLYIISALGAGYTVRHVRKTWSARTLCFLLTVFLMLLVSWKIIMIFADVLIFQEKPDETIAFQLFPLSAFLGVLEDFLSLICRLCGKLFGLTVIFVVNSLALKALAADLLWEDENTIKSITFRHGNISIKEKQEKYRWLWLDRSCVVLGWIFLLMNLLMVIYRCVGSNSKFFAYIQLLFF
ncbi:MAG: hypothetical protein IKO93_18585 [Lentisphaeria bacterium]|nr:hypothetical protein [Lentisphaeria bacterium]